MTRTALVLAMAQPCRRPAPTHDSPSTSDALTLGDSECDGWMQRTAWGAQLED